MIKNIVVALLSCLLFSFAVTAYESEKPVTSAKNFPLNTTQASSDNELSALYELLNLHSLHLNRQAFDLALKGFSKLSAANKLKNANLLSIVDFSQPSTSKRLYIIDVANKKLLFHSLVAHGRNSGLLNANSFSNAAESFKSSLGFYVTSETYQGKHGLSLRLDGMENNINDNARNRAIVMHGADYAAESFTKAAGYLGRSFGCPAIPNELTKVIIGKVKNGSCLFIYSPDKSYLKTSKLLS